MHASATQAAAQSQRLEDWITQLLSRVDGINFGAIGLVSLLMLLYAALSMVVEIEKAFNQIAEAPSGKTWIKRLTHYWTLLTLGPMLLVLGFAVAQGLQPLLRSKLEWVLPMSSTVLLDVLGSVIAIPISAIALMILYTSVPNKRIDFRAALWGGLGAAILWELSKWGLVGYIKYTSSYARLYGVIALLPLFLLWVYVTWIIVLVGFQVTATLQTFRVISREGFQKSVLIALGLMTDPRGNGSHAPGFAHGFAQRVRVLDHSLPLRAMVTIAHRFQGGLTTDVALLSNELATDEALVQGVMDRLCNAGLLNKVSLEGSDGVLKTAHQPTYALAKPASVIMASEVFAAGEDMLEGARDTSRISAELRQARLERFRARTVADLVADVTGQGTPSVPPTLPAAPMHLA